MPGRGVGVGGSTGAGVEVSVGVIAGMGVGGRGCVVVTIGVEVGIGVMVRVGVIVGVPVGVRVRVMVLVGRGVTVARREMGVRVAKAVGVANGVMVDVRVPVGMGVPTRVGVRVGVRVGRGVRVRVGTLVGARRVGTRVGTIRVGIVRVTPGVPSSTTGSSVGSIIIGPGPVPRAVAVGRRSPPSPSGRRSQAGNTKMGNVNSARANATSTHPRGRSGIDRWARDIDSLYHTSPVRGTFHIPDMPTM